MTRDLIVDFLVIGGGVAGVCAANELARLCPNKEVCLVSKSPALKIIHGLNRLGERSPMVDGSITGQQLQEHRVEEQLHDAWADSKITVRVGEAKDLNLVEKSVQVRPAEGEAYRIQYNHKLILCLGARPAMLFDHPRVLGIRDTSSVDRLADELSRCRRLLVVGNGGIALELTHRLTSEGTVATTGHPIEVVWSLKDSYIGNTFLDASASAFILDSAQRARETASTAESSRGVKRCRCCGTGLSAGVHSIATPVTDDDSFSPVPPPPQHCLKCNAAVPPQQTGPGGALGPDWLRHFQPIAGQAELTACHRGQLTVEFSTTVAAYREAGERAWRSVCSSETVGGEGGGIAPAEFAIEVLLSNGERHAVDCIVSAIGVDITGHSSLLPGSIDCAGDGGILVNESFQVSVQGQPSREVYAAGDAVSVDQWELDMRRPWFQMRLWSQARQMGLHAARCAVGMADDVTSGMAFELFTHATSFFGFKLVLLGFFNAQFLADRAGAVETLSHAVVTENGVLSEAEATKRAQGQRATRQQGSSQASRVCRKTRERIETCEVDVLTRVTPGQEYVKLILHRGRVVGALLLGDTELEEAIEHLILNEVDVSSYGINLLDDNLVDLADYFD